MVLYIVRHAWAGEANPEEYPDDGLRPLTKKGASRFDRMARLLVERGMAPSCLATSPLVRCRQTADILSDRLENRVRPIELESLAPGATLDPLLAWAQEQPPGDVAWVGHAPDVGRLAGELIGAEEAAIHFAKGAVAAIEFENLIRAGQGELQWLACAQVLGC